MGIFDLFRKRKPAAAADTKATTTKTTTTATPLRPSAPTESKNSHVNTQVPTLRWELIDIPRKEGEKRIYNLIILDESGSMNTIYNQALSGANETIQTIRNAQKEDPSLVQILTFVTFSSGSVRPDVRAVIHSKIDEVEDLTMKDYHPNGGTPLYDAMGLSIKELSALVQEGDNVLVTVITDGFENSSRSYSASKVKEMVEELRAKGWVFTYIGANQDSVEVAGGLGIRNSMDFRQDMDGTKMMWDKLNSSRREYYIKASRMAATGIKENLEEDFFSMMRGADRVTPEFVDNLGPNEFVVLESNGESGLHGNRYYIDTHSGDLALIANQVSEFIMHAQVHPGQRFLVTRVGCGLAGYDERTMAMLFARAYSLPNVALPTSFWAVLDYRFKG